MKIAEGLYMLKLGVTMSMGKTFLYPTLLVDHESIVLIDTGLEGDDQREILSRQFEENGVDFSQLNKIILTHQDFDHIGGLHGILEHSDQSIAVYFHEDERPYIEGEKELIKVKGKIMPSLIKLIKKIELIQLLEDKEVLNILGGLTVIHVPGHTPGNICLYHHKSKTLIAGDSINIMGNKLAGPNPIFTPDLEKAKDSLKKLLDFDVENIICYHGGLFNMNANHALKNLIKSL